MYFFCSFEFGIYVSTPPPTKVRMAQKGIAIDFQFKFQKSSFCFHMIKNLSVDLISQNQFLG